MTIAWLVVDLGDVAARFLPGRRLAALATETGLDTAVIEDRLFVSGLDRDSELGAYDRQTVLDEIIARLDGRIDPAAHVTAWSAAFEPNGVLLDALRRRTFRMCLFTNNGPMINHCLEGPLAALDAGFEVVICSWQLGSTKPSPDAFHAAASLLGSRSDELLLLDDNIANVEAAKASGWRAWQYRSVAEVLSAIDQVDLPNRF